MRGMKFTLGKSWPRNPRRPDPEVVRDRLRGQDRPVSPNSLGL